MNRTLRAAFVVTTSALVACQEKRPDEGMTHNPPMPMQVDAGPPQVEVSRNPPMPLAAEPDAGAPALLIAPGPIGPPHTVNPPPNRRPPLPGSPDHP